MNVRSETPAAAATLALIPTVASALRDLPDVELIALCQQGNQRAFTVLIRRHERLVGSIVYKMAPDWDNHSDMAQEVFIRMWRSIKSLQNPYAFKSWINQIAKNLFYDELRKKPTRLRLVSMDAPLGSDDSDEGATRDIADSAAGPAEMAEGRELSEVMHGAMGNLSKRFREVIVLREVEQLSYEEIAAITGSELGTVKSRLARARAKVQVLVHPYFSGAAA